MRILIIDDNEVSLELLNTALISSGYDVEVARDGCQALEILRQGGIRMIISDWEMPRMSGVELCKSIRSGNFPGYVYFIMLTAFDSPQQKVKGLTAGADDFVTKPFHPAELLARVRAGERVLALHMQNR